MLRSRPCSRRLGLALALLLLSLPRPSAADDDVTKAPPPPEDVLVDETLVEAVPQPKPRRAAERDVPPAVAALTPLESDDAPPEAQPGALPEILDVERAEAEDLPGLIETLQERMQASRADSDLPLGDLTRDLEQARLDVERLAELLLRKEIAAAQQRAARAQTEEQMTWLARNLEAAEQQLARLSKERDDIERLAAESAARVDDLAQSLVEGDDERQRLEAALEAARAGAEETRRALAAASRRIDDVNREMASLEATSREQRQAHEQQVATFEAGMRELEAELTTRKQTADALIAAREAEIAELAQREARTHEVLVRVLAEFDAVAAARDIEQARAMLDEAQAANEARTARLADMGFSRDADGNLVAPEVALAEDDTDLAAIEPAAGPSCLDEAKQVARPYLDDTVAADWPHYLMGTIPFTDAAARPDDAAVDAIIACLTELGNDAAFYFRVIGHTDSGGPATANQRLSLERAKIVRDLVATEAAVQPWRLLAQGRGPDFPIADNATAEGQAANRRVEVFAIETGL